MHDVVREARGLLPWQAVWGSTLAYLAVVPLATWLVLELAATVGGRRRSPASDAHWTQAARRRWEGFLLLQRSWMVTVLVLALLAYPFVGLFQPLGFRAMAGATFLASALGSIVVAWRLQRDEPEAEPLGRFARGRLRQASFLKLPAYAALTALLFLPEDPGAISLGIAVAVAALAAWYPFGGAPRLARWLGFAEEAPAELRAAIDACAHARGLSVRRSWLVDLPMANAFAFVLTNEIGVTRRAYELLAPDELEAIVQHELAHLAEPRGLKLARSAVLLPVMALPFVPIVGLGNALPLLGFVVAGLVVVLLFKRRFARHEQACDDAARHEIEDAAALARALEKLHRANRTPAVLSGKPMHPSLHDRMLASGVQPDYERPEPPSGVPQRRGSLAALLASGLLAYGALQWRYGAPVEGDPLASLTRGGGPWDLVRVGWNRALAGEHEPGLTLVRAGGALEPRNPWFAYELARLCIELDRDDEAREAIREASIRADAGHWGAEIEGELAGLAARLEEGAK